MNRLKPLGADVESGRMPTITLRPLRLLAPLALALALLTILAAAPPAARAADDAATQTATAADADADADEPDEMDTVDEPDDGTAGDDCDTKSLKQEEADEAEEAEDEPSDGDFRSCDGEGDGASSPFSPTSVAAILRTGKFNGGSVRITGPGSIEQTLTLPGGTKAKGSRVVLGKAKRNVTRAGRVRMTITLTQAGKAKLKRAKGKVTVTLTTKVKVRGATKARTTTRMITLKGA